MEVVQQTPNLGNRDLAGIFQRGQDYAPYTFQTPATFRPIGLHDGSHLQ